MKYLKKTLVLILGISMLITAGPIQAYANSKEYRQNLSSKIDENQLEIVLDKLNKIPDYMLSDLYEKELKDYLNKNNIYFVNNEKEGIAIIKDRLKSVSPYGFWEGAECVGAIALFLGGTGLAIKGVKTLIKAAGGAKALASALILYIRTGKLPSFISNKPSLFDVFKRVGSAILTVTGLDACTKISD